MSSKGVRFGTDGWRGVIADEFTFANLERVAHATALTLADEGRGGSVVIGHDRRFLAASHADRVADILASHDFRVLRVTDAAPTPAISGLVVDHRARAGIVLTASHNPPQFGGYKIKSASGGSAPAALTAAIEARMEDAVPLSGRSGEAPPTRDWQRIDFRPGYLARLATRIDLARLRDSPPLTIVVDSMHGCGDDLIAQALEPTPHRVITLRRGRDVLFGGAGPEPLPSRLKDLQRTVLEEKASLGLATDGDADRLAAVDDTGRFLTALQITPLLAEYLIDQRGEHGTIAKTFANTILLDRIAAHWRLPFQVHPIGFKHLVPLMTRGELLIGGEESGGIGVSGYLPERDGILVGLLLVEMCAARGRSLAALLRGLWDQYGEFHYRRVDLPVSAGKGRQVAEALAANPPRAVAGIRLSRVEDLDGVKLHLGPAGWVMVRPSGTEPVLRIYCEARTVKEVDTIIDETVRLTRTGGSSG
ncbi:MAG: phosphoglucomutase/phosphomannomutase family protein [Acidobacteriota bacterium]